MLVADANVPANSKKLDHLILAHGEVTGHVHEITRGDALLLESGESIYLDVQSASATLTHQEHEQIVLPNGQYKVLIQREYEPSGLKKVTD